MNNSERVILNSLVLYVKILVCIVLSLWTVPIVLHGLGASDYGLYSLVAGVIAMLAFFKTAMSSSTQRYLSVARGKGDVQEMNAIFNSAIMLHLLFGILLVIVLEALTPFLFGHFLNILPERIFAGKIIYQTLLISMFLTIITVPLDAELNAYENMPVFAIIEIFDYVFRLLIAISLQYIDWDKLIWYGAGMAFIPFMNFSAKYIYTRYKYKGLHIQREYLWNPTLLKQMFSFTGWNTFGALAMVGRNQGLAIILNLFFGTVMNAAYGIANQINSVMGYFSQTLRKSLHPQLMQSEGRGDRERMLRLVFTSSKFCVLVMGVIAIPLIVELPLVLKMWLTDVPEYALEFTQWILVTSMVYQMSAGLMAGILSVGKVKAYQIVISILMLINLPIAYILLKTGYEPYWIIIGMFACEVLSLAARLVFSKRLIGLHVGQFCGRVILPLLLIMVANWLALRGITHIIETSFTRLILNSVLSVLIVGGLSWIMLLNTMEKNAILQFINKFTSKFKR